MSALSKILRAVEGQGLMFWCPGCDEAHVISCAPGRWTWNGDPQRPTFAPSVLVRSGHYMPEWGQRPCYCTPMPDGSPWGFKCHQCHSFVTDGQIQFLGDCTHKLVGQTVALPDWTGD